MKALPTHLCFSSWKWGDLVKIRILQLKATFLQTLVFYRKNVSFCAHLFWYSDQVTRCSLICIDIKTIAQRGAGWPLKCNVFKTGPLEQYFCFILVTSKLFRNLFCIRCRPRRQLFPLFQLGKGVVMWLLQHKICLWNITQNGHHRWERCRWRVISAIW